MKDPLVSVVMPVYNAEKYLSQAIESILNQSYKNFEFIIIDDCSTDNSFEIIKKYGKKDKRIIFFRNNKNLGRIFSLNKGIRLLKGKYIARMDADDMSTEDRIKKQVNFLENNCDYIIVGSNIEIIDENNKSIGKRIYPETDKEIKKTIYFKSPFAHPSVCIKREIFKKENYEDKFVTVEDYYLWWKILKYGKGYNIQENLLKYRISKTQEKSIKLKTQLLNTINLQKTIFEKSKNIPFLAYFNHFLLRLIYYLPNKLILELFKFFEYKKN